MGDSNNADSRRNDSAQTISTPDKPVVLLDCDGVLADFIGGVLPIVEAVTLRAHTPDDVDQFNFCTALKLSPDEARRVKKGITEPGFCASLRPYPNAIAGVRRLSEIAEIFVVTSPWNSCPTWTHEREAWLERYFNIPHARVIHGSAKHLVRGDVFVDDKTETVEKWRAAHPGKLAVLWSTPHNRRDSWDGARTSDWTTLCELVRAQTAREVAGFVFRPDETPVSVEIEDIEEGNK